MAGVVRRMGSHVMMRCSMHGGLAIRIFTINSEDWRKTFLSKVEPPFIPLCTNKIQQFLLYPYADEIRPYHI